MTGTTPHRRVLFVHAHPDDETINNGATMARYSADGAGVTLLTCTLGEEGEVLVPELAGLVVEQADQLGGYRISELADAMQELGVTDSRFLGGVGRWRDSGMMGTPANDHPRAFWQADLDEICAAAVEVIRDVRPQVLVTYDENGGYPHPDHIRCHEVSVAAFDAAGDPDRFAGAGDPWQPLKLYYSHGFSRKRMQLFHDELVEAGIESPFTEWLSTWDPSRPDVMERVTTQVECGGYFPVRDDALRAHATQIDPSSRWFAVPLKTQRELWPTEEYELARSLVDTTVPEDDLFEGVRERVHA